MHARHLIAVLLAFAAFAGFSPDAVAQQTVGGMVTSMGNDVGRPFMWLIVFGSLLAGLFLVGTGLMRLIDISGGREGIGKDAMTRLLGGGMLSTLPYIVYTAGAGTFFGDSFTAYMPDGITATDPSSCLGGSGMPMACVAKNVAENVARPAISVIMGLANIAGTWLVASALYKLAVSQGQGHGQDSRGWLPRIIFGSLLTQISSLIAAVASTLGYSTNTLGTEGMVTVASPLLSYTGAGSATIAEYSSLLSSIFVICMMVGAISVWRGISKLRSHAEGTEREGVGSGITHIAAGVMLANAQMTICFVVRTFVGASFCT